MYLNNLYLLLVKVPDPKTKRTKRSTDEASGSHIKDDPEYVNHTTFIQIETVPQFKPANDTLYCNL